MGISGEMIRDLMVALCVLCFVSHDCDSRRQHVRQLGLVKEPPALALATYPNARLQGSNAGLKPNSRVSPTFTNMGATGSSDRQATVC